MATFEQQRATSFKFQQVVGGIYVVAGHKFSKLAGKFVEHFDKVSSYIFIITKIQIRLGLA